MKFCKKCDVSVVGNRKYCPLCQNLLVKKDKTKPIDVFPYIPTLYVQHNNLFRILLFISAFMGIGCFVINLSFPQQGWWSLFVLAGIACFWLVLYVAIYKKSNVIRSIIYQGILICLLALLWDWLTHWHAWSIHFVIPITLSVVMILMFVLAIVLKLQVEDYIIYLWCSAIFGLIPIFLILFKVVTIVIPSMVCILISFFFLLTLLVFQGKNIKTELKRRFHI